MEGDRISEAENEEEDNDLRDIMDTLRKSLNNALGQRLKVDSKSASRLDRHKSEENYGKRVHKSPLVDSGPPSRGTLLGDGGGTGGDNVNSRNYYENAYPD